MSRDANARGTGPTRGCVRASRWRLGGASATIDPVMVPEPAVPVVRRATESDVDAMAAQLARTFYDDPVIGHIFRNEARRDAGLRAYFGTQMRADYLPFGGCYTTDDHAGSAIWAPAGKPMLTGLRAVLTLLPVFPYVAAHMVTTLRLLNLVEGMHPKEPHWYLATLGTAVERQGTGVGSALDAARARALRCGGRPGLSGVVQGAQRAVLPAPRLRGGQGGAVAGGRAAHLDHVAGPAGRLSPRKA